MSRTLPDWIDTYIDYSKSRGSPELFRKWSAISAVAAALERKVWLQSNFPTTYPNLYIIMVGSAGSGKSVASNQAMSYVETLDKAKMAPNNVSRASLVDALCEASREILRPGELPNFVRFHAMTVHARELEVLIPGWDGDFMSHLTDLFDCGKYVERKRGGDLHREMEATWLNILGDCTPSYFADKLPISAWESGFMSRVILIYSGGEASVPLTLGKAIQNFDAKHIALKTDLAAIHELYGELIFSDEAAEALGQWHEGGQRPRVTHPRLQSYNSRRLMHVMKLSMIASVSRSDGLIIELEDYQRALGWLLEAEVAMPGIFVAMQSGGDAIAMRDTWDYVLRESERTQHVVSKSHVIRFLSTRIPSYNINQVLSIMVESGMLVDQIGPDGRPAYKAGTTIFH